jgi:hypothetical protein
MDVRLVPAPQRAGEKEQRALKEKAAEMREELKEKKAPAESGAAGTEK